MELDIKVGRGYAIANMKGELDHHGCHQIKDDLDVLLNRPSTKVLILDMEHVSFMDSSGMGLLMARNKTAMDKQVKIMVIGASPEITKLLQMVNLDKQIELMPTLVEAVEYVERGIINGNK